MKVQLVIFRVIADVEHATSQPGSLTHGVLPLPHLKYEGFESSPQDVDDTHVNLQHIATPVSYGLVLTTDTSLKMRKGRWSIFRH